MTREIFDYVTLTWCALAIVTFFFLLRQTQPYGRHTSERWGPMISNKWGWVIQEVPSMILFSLFFFVGSLRKTPVSYVFWVLWTAHYLNRSLIFPFRIRTEGKKIPILIVCSAIIFNFCNGFLNGYFLGNFGSNFDASYLFSPGFLFGFAIFVAGFVINNHSDAILISLRRPGETGYKIPTGGLFKYVSCPNHFGEIVEWLGFAVMVGSMPAWSFAIWTFCNLVPRALDHHKWYLQKFPDYPKERKAVLPLVL